MGTTNQKWQTINVTLNIGRAMGPPDNDEKGTHDGVLGADTFHCN